MKKELELLKIGTASKSFGAAAGLVMVKDGIASTYDGTTRVQVPLDMADCQFQITPAASALQVMSEPTVKVDKSALVISEGKMRGRVPLVVVDAFTPPSPHGELHDAPVSTLEAMAHVASFCGAGGARPFTSCVRVVGGLAYATASYSGGRYPVEDKDLTITLEVKQLAPLLKLKIERSDHDLTTGKIHATRADTKDVTISLKYRSARETEVVIRVGLFGDKDASGAIQEKIRSLLVKG